MPRTAPRSAGHPGRCYAGHGIVCLLKERESSGLRKNLLSVRISVVTGSFEQILSSTAEDDSKDHECQDEQIQCHRVFKFLHVRLLIFFWWRSQARLRLFSCDQDARFTRLWGILEPPRPESDRLRPI